MKWRKRGKGKGKKMEEKGGKTGEKKGGEKRKERRRSAPPLCCGTRTAPGGRPAAVGAHRERCGSERFGCGNGAVRVGAEVPLRAAQRG